MPSVLNGLEWQTCLRRILFLHANDSAAIIQSIQNGELRLPTIEVFRGHDAYQFLLETICGYNSPIVGETAVMGQFKEFSQRAKFPMTPWGRSEEHMSETPVTWPYIVCRLLLEK